MRRYYDATLGDLATGVLTWRQLIGWVRNLPDDCALARSQDGEAVAWGLHGQLMAAVADLLAIANWQRAGCKGSAPKPIRRPGVGESAANDSKTTQHGGPTGMTNDEVMAVLHGYRTGAYEQQRDDTDEG